MPAPRLRVGKATPLHLILQRNWRGARAPDGRWAVPRCGRDRRTFHYRSQPRRCATPDLRSIQRASPEANTRAPDRCLSVCLCGEPIDVSVS